MQKVVDIHNIGLINWHDCASCLFMASPLYHYTMSSLSSHHLGGINSHYMTLIMYSLHHYLKPVVIGVVWDIIGMRGSH